MRIAFVTNTSWNIYNFRMRLIKSMQDLGYEIHVIAPMDGYSESLKRFGCIYHEVQMDNNGTNPLKDLLLIKDLYELYRTIRPDYVLHFTIKPNIYGAFAASLLRLRIINNVCGLGTTFLSGPVLRAVSTLLHRFSFKLASKVFFHNWDDLSFFLSKGIVRIDRAGVVPGSGIDLSRFQPVRFRRNRPFTFLLGSRLIKEKGIFEYIEAIKIIERNGLPLRFQLVGSIDTNHRRGINSEMINEWVSTGIVEYLGAVVDIRPYIRDADCVVLPSYREGTPRVLLEAASMSKPIITTDVPGCRNVVVDSVNGFLCRARDAKDLAEKMIAVSCLDDNSLKLMGESGRKKMEREFNDQIVIDKYHQTIRGFEINTDFVRVKSRTLLYQKM